MNRKKQWTILIASVLVSAILIAGCGNAKQTEPEGLAEEDVITQQTGSNDEQSPFIPPQTDAGAKIPNETEKTEISGTVSGGGTETVTTGPTEKEAEGTTAATSSNKATEPISGPEEPTFVPPVIQDPEKAEATTDPISDTTVGTTEHKPTVPAEENPKEPEAASTQGSTAHIQPSEDDPSTTPGTGELDEGEDASGYYGAFF